MTVTPTAGPIGSPATPSAALAHHDAEATIEHAGQVTPVEAIGEESCLVQIYPADVIDGMLSLDSGGLSIGRDIVCDLALDDTSVSRRHAEITLDDQGHWITDHGSTNGTLVNGVRVDHVRLQSGDRITIGSFIFKYLSAGSVESQYHETVYQSLTRDALTGTLNKRVLLDSLRREIARSRRDHRPIAIAMMDIDHFKSVNDTHGHLVGDEVLREFGRRLSAECREDDVLARYGGEEFSLLMASTSREESLQITERCRCCIADTPFETAAGALSVSASFGIAIYCGEEKSSPNELLQIADMRLYDAKRGGRNRVIG
ncbi:GGDEF domain-containing protein [Crateriforma conspicua]|uniref:GGDEF domain-containing protein n=1 Tax=Crateriforma conspicua TaxID=2527996 RepID=UPI00118A57AB|nr:GGDEF domain-containing protein [Crateriforma conspicua]QDV65720.1 Response regulator PleD [Crateriforma conspicua]